MSTTYFRGLTRSQYDSFLRWLRDGRLQYATRLKLITAGVLDDSTGWLIMPQGIHEEHAAWRTANYTPDGRRIRPAGTVGGRRK